MAKIIILIALAVLGCSFVALQPTYEDEGAEDELEGEGGSGEGGDSEGESEIGKSPTGEEDDNTLPRTVTEEDLDVDTTIQDLTEDNFIDAYKLCTNYVAGIFGSDWVNEVKYSDEGDESDPLATTTYVPFAYAVQYMCEDCYLGVINEESGLPDEVTATASYTSKIPTGHRNLPGYLRCAGCYDKVASGEFQSPIVEVGEPDQAASEALRGQQLCNLDIISSAKKIFQAEVSARRCAWPHWPDKIEVKWDHMVRSYILNEGSTAPRK